MATSAESYEVTAFQRCFSILQRGLQHELSAIVPLLFAESLISSENRDKCLSRIEPPHERAAHLLSVLESRIHIDPASFNSIVRELDSCPTLQVLAKKLRSELEKVKGERSEREQQLRPPTEMQVPTEEVQEASASIATSTQLACVHSTALDVQREICSLEEQFANLVVQLICMLTILESKSDDFVHTVRAVVLAIPLSLKRQHLSFLENHRRNFAQAYRVSEILDILCTYWDYLNVSLFERMVMKFGDDEIKAELKTYLAHLRDFRQKTKLGDYIDALGGDRTTLPQEFVEVETRMGSSWEEQTLEDAEQLRLRQCARAQIASYGLSIAGGRRKCIILRWGVAEMAVTSLHSVLDDTEQRECDILAIDYNATAIVLDTLPTAEHTASNEAQSPNNEAQTLTSDFQRLGINEQNLTAQSRSRPLPVWIKWFDHWTPADYRDIILILSNDEVTARNSDVIPRCSGEITEKDRKEMISQGLSPDECTDDISILQARIRLDKSLEMVDVIGSNYGSELSRKYVLQQLEYHLITTKKPGVTIYFIGHGKKDTGDWCFKDGFITFRDIAELYSRVFRHQLLTIITDCSHSGAWVDTCMEYLDEQGVRPCGHSMKEKGILLKVYASCRPEEVAATNCFFVQAAVNNKKNGAVVFYISKQLRESQQAYGLSTIEVRCGRSIEEECTLSPKYSWRRWSESKRIYILSDHVRKVWHYVLLDDDPEKIRRYKYLIHGEQREKHTTIDPLEFGQVLKSGWGENPPNEVTEEIHSTYFIF